jgi:hypothetical protein
MTHHDTHTLADPEWKSLTPDGMVYPSDVIGSFELRNWTHSELCFEIEGSSGHLDPWGTL